MTQYQPMDELFQAHGLKNSDLMTSLGVTRECVRRWRYGINRVTPTLAREIEKKFGVPKHLMRPDIFDAPPTPAVSKGRTREPAEA